MAWNQVMTAVAAVFKLDRLLLVIYLFALLGLLMLPTEAPQYRLLGIGADKWMHLALFGGLAVFLRWNLSASRYPIFISVSAALIVAAGIEIAQGLVAYRNAESLDLLAGFLGAIIGAVGVNRIVSSPVPERLVGFLVSTFGLLVVALFALADVIGVGQSSLFGVRQIAGTALGVLITAGGAWVCFNGSRAKSRPI